MKHKPPVLVVGQGVRPTGYARVISSILKHLKDRYEFHHFGINYNGPPLDCGWKVYPNELPGDILGVEQLPLLVEKIRPRLLFFVHDMYLYQLHRPGLDKHRCQLRTIAYFPVEGVLADPAALKGLDRLDTAVLFTDGAARAVERSLAALNLRHHSFCPPSLKVIPHGVDTNAFRPCTADSASPEFRWSRIKARASLFRDRPELSNAFIVLNANRNQPRKRIDITVEAFALFARDKPENVKLYLHMGTEDRGYKLSELRGWHDLKGRVLLTTESAQMPNIPDGRLNLIYNACDVGLNTSTGEGWGLVAFEHAATGAAQVMPRHSACAELWRDAALLVDPMETFKPPTEFVVHKIVSPADVANALERIYETPTLLQEFSTRGYKRATVPELEWGQIADKWDRLFQDELNG